MKSPEVRPQPNGGLKLPRFDGHLIFPKFRAEVSNESITWIEQV